MTEVSARFALPLIAPGQAQKEMTHNEALTLVDLALHASVVEAGVDVPPANPQVGQCWIVGSAPTGAWAGQARAIAGSTAGGWRFVQPQPGMRAWVASRSEWLGFVGTAWTLGGLRGDSLTLGGAPILASRAAAIAAPSGGATIDGQARAAIAEILAALQHHRLID